MIPAFPQASPLFDKIVFKKVKQRLGGNVKLLVSGGAPLAPHVEDFLKVAMCAPVVQVRVRHWGRQGGGGRGGLQEGGCSPLRRCAFKALAGT